MRLSVADLMTERPVTVAPDCSADAAVELLSRCLVDELYVVDDRGRLLGLVPDYELLKVELSGEAQGATVEQLMSRNIPVFTPQTDAAEVARLFRDGRYRQFPVVTRGKLVGVVTRGDVVRLMAVLRRIDSAVPPELPKVQRPRIASRRPRATAGKRSAEAPAPRRRSTRSSRGCMTIN